MIVILNNVDLLVFVKHTNCVFRAVVTFKHYSDILHPPKTSEVAPAWVGFEPDSFWIRSRTYAPIS